MTCHRLLTSVAAVVSVLAASVSLSIGSTDQPNRLIQPQESSPCVDREEPLNSDDWTFRKPQRLLDLERKHDVSPADDEVKQQLTQELFSLAQHMLYCSPAPPNRKYPLAYCLYGRVPELDEDHKTSRESREMIESIYKSLEKTMPDCDCP